MATNIFRASKPHADIPHNGFDKTHRDVFSAKVGMLTPCFVEDVFPDSKYQVDNLNIVRVDSIQSAPFARMSQNVEYFFVPYSQIWHDFERFYYERGDQLRNPNNSANLNVSNVVPSVWLDDVFRYVLFQYFTLRCYTDICSFLERQSLTFALQSSLQHRLNMVKQAFLQCDCDIPSHNGSFFNCTVDEDVHGRFCADDELRILDMLGYANFLPLLKQLYVIQSTADGEAMLTEVEAIKALMNTTDSPTYSLLTSHVQTLFDSIIQPTSQMGQSFYTTGVFTNLGRRVSVFRAAAYMKVWNDYFRNSQYDVNRNYSYYFNYDYVVNGSLSDVPVVKFMELIRPRYRQWKKDVFTGSYPSAQFGSVAVAATNNPVSIVNDYKPTQTVSAAVGGTNSNKAGVLYLSGFADQSYNRWNVDASVSALAIRQAMAMQRYKERILRAGNRLPSLQRALFGDDSRYIADAYVDMIGAVSANIDFNTVAATAEGNGQVVGDLSSNGVSTHGGHAFQYHAHDFGVIIGLFYILPESEYEAYQVDRMVTLTESSDFYKPDFANLGLSPVFNFDFNIFNLVYGDQNTILPDAVIGYLARYWQYKTAIDKVHGEFYGSAPLQLDDRFLESLIEDNPDFRFSWEDFLSVSLGAFAQFVTPRDSQTFEFPNLSALYVSPSAVDRIFYANSDEYQSSDQFKVNMTHILKAILPMSVVGLPS